MPICRYMEEIGSAAMLAAKRSAGVTLELILWKCVSMYASGIHETRLPTLDLEPRFQRSPEVYFRGISGPTKTTYVLQNFLLNSYSQF